MSVYNMLVKRLILRILVFSLIMILNTPSVDARPTDGGRQVLLADFGWKFTKTDVTGAEDPAFIDAGWTKVNLPHDWQIDGEYSQDAPTGGSGGYLPTGIGWYRRHFNAPKSWQGKRVRVAFDGVYRNSDVWINGHHLGHRPFGYISFEYDLTPYLEIGKANVLAVRVDNSTQPNSRWYSGSGIYRHVWIEVTDPVHVAQWGTYITTQVGADKSATVSVTTQVQNEASGEMPVTLVSQVLDAANVVVATVESTQTVAAGATASFSQTVTVADPKLWSLDAPYLYRLRSLVKTSGKSSDAVDTPFGIRTIDYDVNKGFLLNGQHIKMQGMCLHHDGGPVGAAVPIGVWERRLHILKQMGCNAIRTSHNPPAPEFLDLCDRMGFLVMDESFDEWKSGKVKHGYAETFDEWSQRDLTDMLHRDRNHPSIVIWSVGNEIGEQTQPKGAEILRPLVETCHREDPTRPVTAACDNIYTDHGGATLDFLNLLDIVGYNYVNRWGMRRETFYADDRAQYPNRKFIGTEDTNFGGPRGEYSFAPVGADKIERPSYAFRMINTEQLERFNAVHDYVIGDFYWTGIDYLGEARWPNKIALSGTMDTCGFPKDSYYFFQSRWAATPMIHLLPHWNWAGREGKIVPVVCYSNCNTIELFLNGRSLGAKAMEFPRQGTSGGWNTYKRPQAYPTTADLHLSWDVPYEPGVLKAVGYIDGQKVVETEVNTAGEPKAIIAEVDKPTLVADGEDVAHIVIRVVDAAGNEVPTAGSQLHLEITGAGSVIGVDNGDPVNRMPRLTTSPKTFNGKCLAIVQAGRKPGEITVRVTGDGLTDAGVIHIKVGEAKSSVAVLP